LLVRRQNPVDWWT